MTQQQALERFASGATDDHTFEAALPVLARMIRAYLVRLGIRAHNLEDVAQEVIIRVHIYRHRRRGTTMASLKWWLHTICRHMAIDHCAAVAFEPDSLAAAAARTSSAPPDLPEALEHCISKLREPDATIFRVRHDLQWSCADIAAMFGWQKRNCERILARARAALIECLRGKGIEI